VCCSGPIGIDVGAANSVVATPRRGGVDVLVNEASCRQTPSLVAFDEDRRLLGQSASSQQISKPESCVSDLKALIGRSFADAQSLRPQPYAKLIAAADGAVQVELRCDGAEQRFSPTQLFAMLLHKLCCSAERELGSPPSECTIAVPLHFNAVRRQAVLDAAEIAGLHGTRLISEGAAVALDYALGRTDLPMDERHHVAFVDAGHSGVQVFVARFRRDSLQILSHACVLDVAGGVRHLPKTSSPPPCPSLW